MYQKALRASSTSDHWRDKGLGTLVTLSVQNMQLAELVRYLADKAGASIVCEESVSSREVSAEFRNTAVSDVLAVIGRRVGVEVARVGGVYYLGRLRREDRGVLVRKVERLSKDELLLAVEAVLSEVGRVVSYHDGLLVVSDRVEMLEKIGGMLDEIETSASNVWVCQLYLVQILDKDDRRIGMETDISFEMSSVLGDKAGRIKSGGEIVAKLVNEGIHSRGRVISQPLLLLLDGETGKIGSGEKIPVPKRSVSPEGTSSTTDYEEVEVGTRIQVEVRGMGGGRGRVSISVEMTEVSGFSGEAPITRGDNLSTTAVVESGGVYLVGELTKNARRRTREGFLPTVFGKSNDSSVVQVWLRTYRISGDARKQNQSTHRRTLQPDPEGAEVRGAISKTKEYVKPWEVHGLN